MEFVYELDAAGHVLRSIELTAEEFETEWRRARAHLADRPREDHFAPPDDGST